MTYISDVHEYSHSDEDEAAAKKFVSDRNLKAINSLINEIIDDEHDELEERASQFISDKAACRAEKFLERVLNGDEDAAMALFGDENGGSRRSLGGHDAGEAWASYWHGTIFETGGVKLRRQIAEAFPDLIISERIKDMEATVEGLTKQIDDLNRQIANRNDY